MSRLARIRGNDITFEDVVADETRDDVGRDAYVRS